MRIDIHMRSIECCHNLLLIGNLLANMHFAVASPLHIKAFIQKLQTSSGKLE